MFFYTIKIRNRKCASPTEREEERERERDCLTFEHCLGRRTFCLRFFSLYPIHILLKHVDCVTTDESNRMYYYQDKVCLMSGMRTCLVAINSLKCSFKTLNLVMNCGTAHKVHGPVSLYPALTLSYFSLSLPLYHLYSHTFCPSISLSPYQHKGTQTESQSKIKTSSDKDACWKKPMDFLQRSRLFCVLINHFYVHFYMC